MDASLLAGFTVAALLLSIAPGPDMMFIMANGTVAGRRGGLTAAVGVSAGLAVHTVAAALGLGALLQAAPAVLDGVRVFGAVILGYLAVSALWASRRQAPAQDTDTAHADRRRPMRKIFVLAALTNLANPKVVLFYLAFLPQFLTTGAGAWPVTAQLLILGMVLLVVGLMVDGTVAVLVGSLRELLVRRSGIRRWMDRVAAAVFGGLALRLAWESAR